jgi:hypothetical protein
VDLNPLPLQTKVSLEGYLKHHSLLAFFIDLTYTNITVSIIVQPLQQQERRTKMLYIKSYLDIKGESFVLKEADEVDCKKYTINLNELHKQWLKAKTPEGLTKNSFTNEVEFEMLGIAGIKGKLYDPYCLTNAIDFDNYDWSEHKDGYTKFKFFVISYHNTDNEKKYFVPSGKTYIVNEQGATIASISV